MRCLSSIILAVIMFATAIATAAPEPEPGASSQFITRQRGSCNITVAKTNEGVIATLAEVCERQIPEIFRQLNSDPTRPHPSPVNIRIVTRPSEMHRLAPAGSSLPVWSGAVAFPSHNLILLPLQRIDGGPVKDLESTLLHEVSHVAFHRISNGARTPRWFSEGVAILQSEGSSFHRKQSIWWASLIDHISPLSEIEKYPEGAKSAEQAYAQAADFTAFLIEKKGWNSIRYLLNAIGAGEPFKDAFRQSYGADVTVLEKKWHEQLFGGMGWLIHVTGDGMWLGIGALICIAGYFLVRKRKNTRLREMEEEEKQLESAIATIDQLIATHPGSTSSKMATSQVMDRIQRHRTKIEVDGDIHTLH
jgi:LPXTG-motif cell wall-anchored protein